MILLLYVDDIILIGNCFSILQFFVHVSSQQLVMKDLGDLHYYLVGPIQKT